jgi:hypothetical protein
MDWRFSANLTQNTTNPVLRFTSNAIDCIATNGTTALALNIGNSAGINMNGNVGMAANRLVFGDVLDDYKINLWGGLYGIGIRGGTTTYFSQSFHNFYNSSSPTNPVVSINVSTGSINANGAITNGGNSYITAGGLRLGGFDTGNTIYQATGNIGITMNFAQNPTGFIGLGFFGGNGYVFRVYNTAVVTAANCSYQLTDNTGSGGWIIQSVTSPTNVTNSLVFNHSATGINSRWWFNGTQTNTNSEVSDKRSKYNIQDFSALETIKKLKPKSFDVIDDKDVKFQFGFIAQDIEEIPELNKLVFTEPNYIANVNSYGTRRNDGESCIITANDDLTGKIEIGDELKFVSDNKENQEFILDATPYHNRCKRRYGKITEIISSTEFKVDCEINKLCCHDDEPFLIYGKKVEDAKSLDYNSFIAINTKAIQELYKIIQ